MTARRRLVGALGVLMAVYWIGTIGYLLIEPSVKLDEAMYMMVITLATVGYKEPFELSPAGRAWTMLVIVVGVTAAAVAFGSLSALIIEGEIGRLIGSRKLETRIRQLKDHVIVCGYGRMGRLLVHQLAERGVGVVVIEKEPGSAREAVERGRLTLVGDATEEAMLERAGIRRAKSLVGALPSDADNVFVTLTARQMAPDLTIVARAEQFSAEPKLLRAGATRVVSPQAIGAERIANMLTRPFLVELVDEAARGVDFEVDQFVVPPESPIAGKTLRDLKLRRRANVMVVAIKRKDGTTHFSPPADEVVRQGDTLITIGQAGSAGRLAGMGVLPEDGSDDDEA